MSFVKDEEPTADLSQIAADLEKLPKAESKSGLTFSGTPLQTDYPPPLMSHVDFAKLAAKMDGVPPDMVAYTHTFEPNLGIGHGNAVVDALWNATYALAKQIKQDGITKPLTVFAAVAPEHKYLVNSPNLADVTIKKLVVTVKLEE